MADTGWKTPGNGYSRNDSASPSWVSVGNITVDDSSCATDSVSASIDSDTLEGYNFGFSVPSGAVIDGVEIRVKCSADDSSVGIVSALFAKNDSTLGNDLEAGTTALSPSTTYYTYGGPTELGGLSLTPSDVNGSTFQVRFKYHNSNGSIPRTVYAFAVSAKVYYHFELSTDKGTFNLSGQDITARRALRLTASHGAFSQTGKDAGLRAERVLAAVSGSFAENGQISGFSVSRRISAEYGSYSHAGQTCQLIVGAGLNVGYGAVGISGQDILLTRSLRLVADGGLASLNGKTARLVLPSEEQTMQSALRSIRLGMPRVR